MSKFIDRLNRLSRGEAQPIGFTAKQAASAKSKIQLVASLVAESAESLAGQVAGADAGLLSISRPANGAEVLPRLSQSLPDVIWGLRLRSGSPEEIKQLTRAGGDFVVFSALDTPLTIIKNSGEAGKILEVEASLSEGLLRTVNELPVDAVLIAGEEGENWMLTWQHLMLFRRFGGLLTKPLLAAVPLEVSAGELEALWQAGVTAVVLEISPKQPEGRLAKLRQEIDKLEFSSRRAKRAEALAPRISQPTGRVATEGDEEEEEE